MCLCFEIDCCSEHVPINQLDKEIVNSYAISFQRSLASFIPECLSWDINKSLLVLRLSKDIQALVSKT